MEELRKQEITLTKAELKEFDKLELEEIKLQKAIGGYDLQLLLDRKIAIQERLDEFDNMYQTTELTLAEFDEMEKLEAEKKVLQNTIDAMPKTAGKATATK